MPFPITGTLLDRELTRVMGQVGNLITYSQNLKG